MYQKILRLAKIKSKLKLERFLIFNEIHSDSAENSWPEAIKCFMLSRKHIFLFSTLRRINKKFISLFNFHAENGKLASDSFFNYSHSLLPQFVFFFSIFNEFLSKASFLQEHNYFHSMRKKQQSISDWFIKFHYFVRLLHFHFSFFRLLFLCLWLFLPWDFFFAFKVFVRFLVKKALKRRCNLCYV